ncbi:MAG TPA: SAM-dependent methyltransferase [Actinomycetes bacterium]|nr:SAM-dependent methyltransferase [Actinomycetes bacterium]
MAYVPWEQAWQDALYGPAGFFRTAAGGTAHFRTCATSAAFAGALLRLARDLDVALGEPDGFVVVDVGAGDGSLLTLLAAHAPQRWRLIGVDISGRPAGLAGRVEWANQPPADVVGLLLANELLDALPCPLVACDDSGVTRLVLVDPATGTERLGPEPAAADLAWLDRWWPLATGERAEVGRPRDLLWSSLADRVEAGAALAIDYGHTRDDRASLPAGSLAGYRDGARVPPVPDGSCDLTAHVALDSCAAASPSDGWTLLARQADLLPVLGVSARLPPAADARTDPRTYARRLAEAADARLLLDPDGPGRFGWLLHGRGLPEPGMMPS